MRPITRSNTFPGTPSGLGAVCCAALLRLKVKPRSPRDAPLLPPWVATRPSEGKRYPTTPSKSVIIVNFKNIDLLQNYMDVWPWKLAKLPGSGWNRWVSRCIYWGMLVASLNEYLIVTKRLLWSSSVSIYFWLDCVDTSRVSIFMT